MTDLCSMEVHSHGNTTCSSRDICTYDGVSAQGVMHLGLHLCKGQKHQLNNFCLHDPHEVSSIYLWDVAKNNLIVISTS